MKTLRFISTFVMLALATVVTAGSMYVTVTAAAHQESTELLVTPASGAQENAVGTDVVAVPGLEAAIAGREPVLDKTQILRDQQSHVILDENGGFKGRLSSFRNSDGAHVPVANLNVTLAQHGAIIGTTTTDAEGQFSFTGLPEGVVAIWAEGEDSLMLFSFVLFGNDTTIGENADLVAAQVELDVDSAVVTGVDIATVRDLMALSLHTEDKRFANEVVVEDREFHFGSGEVNSTLRNRSVSLQADGSLKGEVSILDDRTGRLREVLDMTVHFVRNGVRVASSEVSNDGSFIANGLTPGVYSVVAVGQDGILVCSVDVVGTSVVENVGAGEFTPVSTVSTSLMLGGFGGCPVGPGNLGAFAGASGGGGLGQTAMNSAPPAGGVYGQPGGGSGGGFGGGGGVVGGGGLGWLLAGGIGGAIGYLIGENQNDNDNAASPGI